MTYFSNQPTNAELGDIIIDSNRQNNDNFNSLHRHLDATRPKRPKITNYYMGCAGDGNLCLINQKDNFTAESIPVFVVSYGSFDIYHLTFSDYKCDEKFFLIHFPAYDKTVVGSKKRMNERYFYNCFIERDFHFNMMIPRAKLQRALFEYFAPLIANHQNEIVFPGLAGFDDKMNFMHSEMVPSKDMLNFLPITGKKFITLPLTKDTFVLYRKELLKFADPFARYMIVTYPFISMLSSIFAREGLKFDFSLNFVPTNGIDVANICNFFQVFNRHMLLPIDFEATHKTMTEFLQKTNDEVIIMDLRITNPSDYYRRKLCDSQFNLVSSTLAGQKVLQNQMRTKITAGLVTISNETIMQKNVFNILLNDEINLSITLSEYNFNAFKENCTMERIFSGFITFIEGLGNDIFPIFFRKRTSKTSSGIILEIVMEILQRFWQNNGLDFCKELNFPKNMNFDAFLTSEEIAEEEEDIHLFINMIRKEMINHCIVPKKESNANENTIFYNEKFVWIPVNIMKEICNKNGLHDNRKILLKLRNKELLLAEPDRLIQRVQTHKQIIDAYKFKYETFNRLGEIDFIHLGKETEKC